jgi:hypothetical protein
MRLLNLLTIAIFPSFLLAITVKVNNYCNFDVWFLSVIPGGAPVASGIIGGKYNNQASHSYSETSTALGRAIKLVTRPDGWWTGAPILNWGYSTDPAGTYTSISDVPRNQHPFTGNKVRLSGTGFDCPTITWQSGEDPGVDRILNCR